MTPETQKSFLQAWAGETNLVVDPNNSPKAEFARLAKAKGWTGGDVDWCHHWQMCFNETYSWGVRNRATTTSTAVGGDVTAQTNALNLTDRMRSLSIGSDASSFSVVSRASRADSFDSVISLDSKRSYRSEGPSVSPLPLSNAQSWDSTDLENSVLSLDTVKSLDELSGGVEIPNHDGSIATDTVTEDSDTESDVSSQEVVPNPAWNDFTNFVHNPSASFKAEFERLARTKGWVGRTKRQELIKLLSTEVEFYCPTEHVDKLEYYQYLCHEMSIEHIPSTITQARRALQPLKVNLYSVIDHMRNPDIKVITYKTIGELRRSVKKMGTFPRVCAKAGGGYMAALLSKL